MMSLMRLNPLHEPTSAWYLFFFQFVMPFFGIMIAVLAINGYWQLYIAPMLEERRAILSRQAAGAVEMLAMNHIFISYSRKDSRMMARLRDDLGALGIQVWTDESLTPGTPSWRKAIEAAIEEADGLVVLLSPDAKESIWVERELDYADTHGVRIFPILVRGDERDSVPFSLIGTQRVDARRQYDSALAALSIALREHIQMRHGQRV
jgi:hypothetical protein